MQRWDGIDDVDAGGCAMCECDACSRAFQRSIFHFEGVKCRVLSV